MTGRTEKSSFSDDSPPTPVQGDPLHQQRLLDYDEEEDFEFSFVVGDPDGTPSITADEIFSHGRILPAYPVFDRGLLKEDNEEAAVPDLQAIPIRRLLIEEAASSRSGSISSSSSSEAEDTESAAGRKYNPWTPRSAPQSPDRCRKSASTGTERRWKLRDLLSGRSHSDGKDKFLFLDAPSPSPSPQPSTRGTSPSAKRSGPKMTAAAAEKGGRARPTEVDVVAAHGMYYGKKGGRGQGVTGPRRSFLPYRQELFGLFTARTSHPL